MNAKDGPPNDQDSPTRRKLLKIGGIVAAVGSVGTAGKGAWDNWGWIKELFSNHSNDRAQSLDDYARGAERHK